MRTDPRKACDNPEESWFWAIVHDVCAHALLGLTFYSRPAVWFHNWTSIRAWPLAKRPTPPFVGAARTGLSLHRVGMPHTVWADNVAPGIWQVNHPKVSHAIRLKAADGLDAIYKASSWFGELAAEFGGQFDLKQ